MKTFWDFKALDSKKGALYIYGPISDTSWLGDEITPSLFVKDLAKLGDIDTLEIFINSPGGDAFCGIAIYNILKRFSATKTVYIDGIAASAASIVAMAGNKIVMPKNSTLMIHDAWSCGVGNKALMRSLAEELERLDGQLASIYSEKTGKDKGVIAEWMSSERWMSGEEAFADGFCDEVEPNKKIAACADTGKYFAMYLHPPEIAPEPAQPQAAEQGGILLPDNGAVNPQPTSDKNLDILADQRKQFSGIRLKLLGGN